VVDGTRLDITPIFARDSGTIPDDNFGDSCLIRYLIGGWQFGGS
jgi:hypothetical protein